jgi:hypothetical protein
MDQLHVLAWGTAPIENGAHWSWFAKIVRQGLRHARQRLARRLLEEQVIDADPGGQGGQVLPGEQGEDAGPGVQGLLEDEGEGPCGQGLFGPLLVCLPCFHCIKTTTKTTAKTTMNTTVKTKRIGRQRQRRRRR